LSPNSHYIALRVVANTPFTRQTVEQQLLSQGRSFE